MQLNKYLVASHFDEEDDNVNELDAEGMMMRRMKRMNMMMTRKMRRKMMWKID